MRVSTCKTKTCFVLSKVLHLNIYITKTCFVLTKGCVIENKELYKNYVFCVDKGVGNISITKTLRGRGCILKLMYLKQR